MELIELEREAATSYGSDSEEKESSSTIREMMEHCRNNCIDPDEFFLRQAEIVSNRNKRIIFEERRAKLQRQRQAAINNDKPINILDSDEEETLRNQSDQSRCAPCEFSPISEPGSPKDGSSLGTAASSLPRIDSNTPLLSIADVERMSSKYNALDFSVTQRSRQTQDEPRSDDQTRAPKRDLSTPSPLDLSACLDLTPLVPSLPNRFNGDLMAPTYSYCDLSDRETRGIRKGRDLRDNISPVTPAPELVTPAPDLVTPAPGLVTLAHGLVTPAPGLVTPAPGLDTQQFHAFLQMQALLHNRDVSRTELPSNDSTLKEINQSAPIMDQEQGSLDGLAFLPRGVSQSPVLARDSVTDESSQTAIDDDLLEQMLALRSQEAMNHHALARSNGNLERSRSFYCQPGAMNHRAPARSNGNLERSFYCQPGQAYNIATPQNAQNDRFMNSHVSTDTVAPMPTAPDLPVCPPPSDFFREPDSTPFSRLPYALRPRRQPRPAQFPNTTMNQPQSHYQSSDTFMPPPAPRVFRTPRTTSALRRPQDAVTAMPAYQPSETVTHNPNCTTATAVHHHPFRGQRRYSIRDTQEAQPEPEEAIPPPAPIYNNNNSTTYAMNRSQPDMNNLQQPAESNHYHRRVFCIPVPTNWNLHLDGPDIPMPTYRSRSYSQRYNPAEFADADVPAIPNPTHCSRSYSHRYHPGEFTNPGIMAPPPLPSRRASNNIVCRHCGKICKSVGGLKTHLRRTCEKHLYMKEPYYVQQ